jgi:phosphatidylinositol alpha-1,6-mannosyltransferase
VTNGHRSNRVVAVPTIGERGGGIGQVSSLLWDVVRDTWPESSELLSLLRNGHTQPSRADKIRFGAELAGRHLFGAPAWVLFGHLGLVQARRYFPAGSQVPYAVFLHGVEAWKPLAADRRKAIQSARLRIANSTFTARAVSDANPGVGDIAVCPLALQKDATFPSNRAPAAARSPRVLVVGRMASTERYKGHEQVIRAWPAVVSRVPNAELIIVGDGDDAARLKRIADGTRVACAIRFSGFLSRAELHAEYAKAALLALPSRGEGFGLVYLEAMAHGVPCLGSVNDAAAEVIGKDDAGVLVDPEDGKSLGCTIAGLLESPARRQQLGDAGVARVAKHFTYERFRRDMALLLRSSFPESEAR